MFGHAISIFVMIDKMSKGKKENKLSQKLYYQH